MKNYIHVCIVERIRHAHLEFERAICCGFTGFTKSAVFIIVCDCITASFNLVFKINEIKMNKSSKIIDITTIVQEDFHI